MSLFFEKVKECKNNLMVYLRRPDAKIEELQKEYPSCVFETLKTFNDDDCYTIIKNVDREKYYIHTHDITSIIDEITVVDPEWATRLNECIDLRIRTNTCNCVTIVIYSKLKSEFQNLHLYINNVVYTLQNIEKFLPDWILRVYIDVSIFDNLNDMKYNSQYKICYNIYNQMLEKLYAHPQCEMYITMCKSYVEETKNLDLTRYYRFLSMCDDTVNICASREADQIMLGIDCYNLKYLERSNNLCFFYILQNQLSLMYEKKDNDNNLYRTTSYVPPFHHPYSPYVIVDLYEQLNVSDRKRIAHLSAGLVTTKFKFKDDYFKVQINIKNFSIIETHAIHKSRNHDELSLFLLFSNIQNCNTFIHDGNIVFINALIKMRYMGYIQVKDDPIIEQPNVNDISALISEYSVNKEILLKYSKLIYFDIYSTYNTFLKSVKGIRAIDPTSVKGNFQQILNDLTDLFISNLSDMSSKLSGISGGICKYAATRRDRPPELSEFPELVVLNPILIKYKLSLNDVSCFLIYIRLIQILLFCWNINDYKSRLPDGYLNYMFSNIFTSFRSNNQCERDCSYTICNFELLNNLFDVHFIKIFNEKCETNLTPVAIPVGIPVAISRAEYLSRFPVPAVTGSDEYQKKYLKYKNKYLKLKKNNISLFNK
jgi:hypothetical protein